MANDKLTGNSAARGRVRLYRVIPGSACAIGTTVLPGVWRRCTGWLRNTVMYDWAPIAARLLAEGNSAYKLSGMYIEFHNGTDPVSIPEFSRGDGISYYNGLSSSEYVDYLRVPIIAITRSSSDESKFPQGNVLTAFAMSDGTVGVHGKNFEPMYRSTVYGGALVAVPDASNRSLDLVFSRFYLPAEQHMEKTDNSQIGIEWEITLQ